MSKPKEVSALNVVIINLISSQFLVRYQAPLAVNILAGYLRYQPLNLNVKTIDMQSIFDSINKGEHLNKEESFKFTVNCIIQKICHICEKNQSVIGLSMKWTTREVAQNIIDGVYKQIGKNKTLFILGNIGSTFGYKELLSHPTFNNVLAVISEGENALTEIARIALEHQQKIIDVKLYKNIPNVAVNINGEIFLNSIKRIDLEKYPPNLIFNPSDIYDAEWDVYAMETSRGCPWGKCTFCSIRSQFSGHTTSSYNNDCDWHPFPLDVILSNIKYFSAKGVRNFDIKDSEFFGPIRHKRGHNYFNKTMRRVEKLAQGIIEINKTLKGGKRSDNKITVNHISVRIDAIYKSGEHKKNKRRKKVFQLLKDAGVKGVYLGIESGSPTQLKRYNKGITVEENMEAIKIMREFGFEIEVGFIFFDPLSVLEELKQNIDFISKTNLYETDSRILGSLRIQEGSPYVLLARQAGLLGKKNADLLSYSSKFQNKHVADLEKVFSQWENATVKLVKLLPVFFRLESYKINFDFLKELVDYYMSDRLIGVKVLAYEYAEKRRRYLSKVRHRLNSRDFGVGNRGFITEYLLYAEKINNKIIMNRGGGLRER